MEINTKLLTDFNYILIFNESLIIFYEKNYLNLT